MEVSRCFIQRTHRAGSCQLRLRLDLALQKEQITFHNKHKQCVEPPPKWLRTPTHNRYLVARLLHRLQKRPKQVPVDAGATDKLELREQQLQKIVDQKQTVSP